jgi:hypothetical protein
MIPFDYSEFTIEIENISDENFDNCLIDLEIYNIGKGYNAFDDESNSILVCGLNEGDVLVSNPLEWKTNIVRVLLPTFLSGETKIIRLKEANSFVDSSNFSSGTRPQSSNFSFKSHIIGSPFVSVYLGRILEDQVKDMYVLSSENPSPDPEFNYDIPQFLTLGKANIISQQEGWQYILLDVSSIVNTYGKLPLVVIDGKSRKALDTVGANSDGSCVNIIDDWDGELIQFYGEINSAEPKQVFIRFANFVEDTSSFPGTLGSEVISHLNSSVYVVESILCPNSIITSLLDMKSISGEKRVIYSYLGVEESIIENVNW